MGFFKKKIDDVVFDIPFPEPGIEIINDEKLLNNPFNKRILEEVQFKIVETKEENEDGAISN